MNTTVPIPKPAARSTVRPSTARFALGQGVRHIGGELRGVVIDADPAFPGDPRLTGRLSPNQTFYKVLVQSPDGAFVACVAETYLDLDPSAAPLGSDLAAEWFTIDAQGHHAPRSQSLH